MSRPPFAERLLLGFLADSALGDAILGDLAVRAARRSGAANGPDKVPTTGAEAPALRRS